MADSEVRDLQAQFAPDELKTLSVPCSGKVTIPYLVKAFEMGADGVVLCGCVPAECRHLEGNLRAARRGQAVDTLMEEVGLGKDRVLMVAKKHGEINGLAEAVERLRVAIEAEAASAQVTPMARKSSPAASLRRENAA